MSVEQLWTGSPLRIGVVGSQELVERTMMVASAHPIEDIAVKLVPVAYENEAGAASELARVRHALDVALFAGPLAYDLVLEHGTLDLPAAYVEVSGSALYGAMLQVIRTGSGRLETASIDSLNRTEVRNAYNDVGVEPSEVRVMPYNTPSSAGEFTAFHERHARAGESSIALTTVATVERELHDQGLPVIRIKPTIASLRDAIRRAALAGAGRLLGDSQPSFLLVTLPQPPPAPLTSADAAELSLRADLARIMIAASRRLQATLIRVDDWTYGIVTTYGGLAAITEDFSTAPLIAQIDSELGIAPLVGIGVSTVPMIAEERAHRAAASATSTEAVMISEGRHIAVLSRAGGAPPAPDHRLQPAHDRTAHLEAQLRGALASADRPPEAMVVDTEEVSALLDVSRQTARRLLKGMVEDGTAWQLPPRRTSQPGRPRQFYRLL